MKFGPVFVKDIKGQEIELRNAEVSDAAALIKFLKIISAETPYLIREPEEITITPEQEKAFLQGKIDSEKELMLLAFADGKHIGNCSLMSIGNYKRYAHRCDIAIALYQAYCGRGIGTILLETILDTAKKTGYEQAELEVAAGNQHAISLYKKMGFKTYGTFPNNMKYSDGRYEDSCWMMRQL